MTLSAIGIIPARYASTRLPAKPLVDLHGKTMIQRVWEGAREAQHIDRIVIATDDERIVAECRRFGADVVLTAPELASGTDRVAAAYQAHCMEHSTGYDIVLNIQGDEPLLRGAVLDSLVEALVKNPADVATPVKRVIDPAELANPTIVTVAVAEEQGVERSFKRALYFSRSPIPFVRDAQTTTAPNDYAAWLERSQTLGYTFWKHIGIYAYRAAALQRFQALPCSKLEQLEQLEQLRLLEQGAVYVCVETTAEFVAIDTPADVETVRRLLAS